MFIAKSLTFYDDKDERGIQIDSPLRQLVHEEILNSVVVRDGSGKRFIPDGIGYITCENFPRYDRAAIFFTELRNGIGAGGSDLISQLQYDYTAFYSSGLVRDFPVYAFQKLIFGSAETIAGCVLLPCDPHRYRWTLRDHRRRCFCRPLYLSEPNRLSLCWRKSLHRPSSLRNRQGLSGFEGMHCRPRRVLLGAFPLDVSSFSEPVAASTINDAIFFQPAPLERGIDLGFIPPFQEVFSCHHRSWRRARVYRTSSARVAREGNIHGVCAVLRQS